MNAVDVDNRNVQELKRMISDETLPGAQRAFLEISTTTQRVYRRIGHLGLVL